jgi:hypothetical protein
VSGSGNSWQAGYRVALLGAIVAHPLVFLGVFVVGATFGASPLNFLRSSPTAYGVQGGKNAVEILIFLYLAVIPALVVSALGAAFAWALWYIVAGRRKPPDSIPPPAPPLRGASAGESHVTLPGLMPGRTSGRIRG